jgi:hypothetical protein
MEGAVAVLLAMQGMVVLVGQELEQTDLMAQAVQAAAAVVIIMYQVTAVV